MIRYRIRRHRDEAPEKLDEFWGWVATFKDGHEEFVGVFCTQRVGIEKERRKIRRRFGTDVVPTLRLTRFMKAS